MDKKIEVKRKENEGHSEASISAIGLRRKSQEHDKAVLWHGEGKT